MSDPASPVLPSPLELPSPARLDELFAKDPLTISDDDLRGMVSHYRAQRALWKQSEAAGPKRRAAKSATEAHPDALTSLTLGDLL